MRLALWADDEDLAAQSVAEGARARGVDVSFVTPGRAGADATDLHAWVLAGADLDACGAHLVRALPSPFVVPAKGEGATDLAARAFQAQERVQLAHAALAAAEARGARVLNPTRSLPFEAKPAQLAAFARAGLAVPRSLLTSLPLAAERFVAALEAEGAQAIAKPLIGGATARVVDAALRARLASWSASPLILQERVPGEDLRVTVVAGRVVSAVIVESAALDYRDDPDYRAGRGRYRAVEPTDEERALALRAAELCHHAVSGVDLKRTPQGGAVLLEANSAPAWLDIEEKTGAPIGDAVLDALLG